MKPLLFSPGEILKHRVLSISSASFIVKKQNKTGSISRRPTVKLTHHITSSKKSTAGHRRGREGTASSHRMTSSSPRAFLRDTTTATSATTAKHPQDTGRACARMGTLTATEPQPKCQEDVEDDGFEEDEPQAEDGHRHQVQRGVCGTVSVRNTQTQTD